MSKKNKNKKRNIVADNVAPVDAVAESLAAEFADVEAKADEVEAEVVETEVAEAEAAESAEQVEATQEQAEAENTGSEVAEGDAESTEADAESEAENAEDDAESEAESAKTDAEGEVKAENAETDAEGETKSDGDVESADSNSDSEAVRKAAAQVTKERKERNEEKAKAKELDAKREARHKRRIRNQIIAYVSVFLFFAIIIAGGIFAATKIVGAVNAKKNQQATQVADETDELISGMLGEEEEIEEPEITEEQIIEEPEPEPVDELGEYIDGIIAGMTLEQKVAGLFLTSPEALTGVDVATVAGEGTRSALNEYQVGGILYNAKNINGKDQFSKMVNGTIEMLGDRPVFIAFSEEGGDKGSALAKAGFYEAQDSPKDIAATNDVNNAYNAGLAIGEGVKSVGINLVLGPITDLTAEGSVLGNKTYGDTAVTSSGYVSHMADGLKSSGVQSCLKYFPGYGNVNVDPATARAVSDRSEADFRSNEFLIYQASIQSGVQMIMMSDVVINAFDDSCPATLSDKIATDILRNELEYEGVIVSANLSDKAVSEYYEPGEAAVLALKAGCDMIQNPTDFKVAHKAVVDAVSENIIAEQRVNDSLKRIYRVLYADKI